MKNSKSNLFEKWWNEIKSESLKAKLEVWLRRHMCNLTRRLRVDPQEKSRMKILQKYKDKLKSPQNRLNYYKHLSANYLYQQVNWANESFRRRQIFDKIPPKTHKKEYELFRQ